MRGLCYFLLSILTQGKSIFSAFLLLVFAACLWAEGCTVSACVCWRSHRLQTSELQLEKHCTVKFDQSLSSTVRSSTVTVTGLVGHNVTLPCKYNIQTDGVLSFCWGRDVVPTFKCSNTILSSQDGVVELRQSFRYQLLAETAGDVSLTILNAQWSDAGVYGCRVEVPGWFNDYKINTHLAMEEGNVHKHC